MNTRELLSYHMRMRGCTVYRLAKESGVSQATLANIFRRGNAPSIPTLEKICAGGITMMEFYSIDQQTDAITPQQRSLIFKWGKLTPKQQAVFLQLYQVVCPEEAP